MAYVYKRSSSESMPVVRTLQTEYDEDQNLSQVLQCANATIDLTKEVAIFDEENKVFVVVTLEDLQSFQEYHITVCDNYYDGLIYKWGYCVPVKVWTEVADKIKYSLP